MGGALHKVTNVDPAARTGDCAACGVGVKVRPRTRPNTGHVYWSCRYRRPGESKGKPESRRRYKFLTRYGIEVGDVTALEAAHRDGCAICGGRDDGRRLALDHCHRTGQLRGFLCSQCNIGLGNFRDSPDLLRAAITYLTR